MCPPEGRWGRQQWLGGAGAQWRSQASLLSPGETRTGFRETQVATHGEHPPSYLPQLHNHLSGTQGGDPLAKEEADLFAPHGCALPAQAWDTHRFAKLQRTPVSRLDSARHVSAGSLVPSEAPGAQEGLKGHWQRGDREAKGHAASSVQGESTKHGYGRPTSLDLCPCPVATAGCVLIQVGDEDEYSAPETRIPAAWCLL